jgi:hypothetical protein
MFSDPRAVFLLLIVMFIVQVVLALVVHDLGEADDDDL